MLVPLGSREVQSTEMNGMATTLLTASANSLLEASSAPTDGSSALEAPGQWRLATHDAIAAIATAWDAFIPRDVPHLRSGMLAAAVQGNVIKDLTCVLVYRDEARPLGDAGRLTPGLPASVRPAAAAVFYTLPIDTVACAPEWVQKFAAWVRRRAPGFLWKSMRVCGSPISNSSSGICFDPELRAAQRREVVSLVTEQLVDKARNDQTIYFRDVPESESADFGEELERQGFFRVTPQPGMVLDVRWRTFDEYLAALRKRYRKRVRDDMKTASALEFTLVDPSPELGPVTARLYQNVLANAEHKLEVLSEDFFAALGQYDQAKLLVARKGATGEVLGVNLLLFSPLQMQNLYIGFDYEQNEQYNTYFALVQHSLRLAIEHGCRVCHFGQDSYEFKSRLGAKPYPLAGYMKHKSWPVHWMLRRNREGIFPATEAATHDVFQEGDAE
jgi:hypothetical protein